MYQTSYHQIKQAVTNLKWVKSIAEMASESLVKDNTYWESVNLHKPSFSKLKMYSTSIVISLRFCN